MKKHIMESFPRTVGMAIVTGSFAMPLSVQATAVDLSPLTSNIDFGSVTTAVLAIGVSLMSVYVAIKGAKVLLTMVKGA